MTDLEALAFCYEYSKTSKDPNTQLGALLIGSGGAILTWGANRFPPGIAETPERLNDRALKNQLMVHAEMSAVLSAARFGMITGGATLYFVATDASNVVWGGCPCERCSVELISAGIRRIVSPPPRSAPSKWQPSMVKGHLLCEEAGVIVDHVDFLPKE